MRIWLLFIALCSSVAHATPEEGLQLRAFVRETVAAAGVADPKERAQALRLAVAHHPEVLQWAADDRDLDPLFKDADLGAGRAMLGAGDRDLKAVFKERMESELRRLLAPEFHAIDPALKKEAAQHAARYYQKMSVDDRVRALEQAGDEPLDKVAGEINGAIDKAQLSKSDAVRTLLDSKNAVEVGGLSPDKSRLLNTLIGKYFDQLSAVEKRKILLSQLALAPFSPVERQLSGVLQNSGPALQKLFQLIGKDAKSKLIQEVMKELLANVTPFSGAEARSIVEKSLGRPISEVFSSFDEEPIAAATVGQVHKARLKSTGEEVVVKVLRPDVRERAKREIETLRSIIGDSTFERDLVNNIEEALMKELDFRIEASNLKAGEAYINADRGLDIARRVEEIPATADVIVQHMAPGTLYSKLKDVPALERGEAINSLLTQWFDEAIFGDGFVHADLHGGNMFYKRLRPRASGKPKWLLTLIDFGSATRLSLEQRRGFMGVAMGVASKSPERTLEAIEMIAKVPQERRKELLKAIQEIYRKEDLSLIQRLNQVFSTAVDKGLGIPAEILQFNRGRMFLEKAITEVNTELGRKAFDPVRTYVKVAARRTINPLNWSDESVVTTDMMRETLVDGRDRVMGYFKGRACDARTYLKGLLRGGLSR